MKIRFLKPYSIFAVGDEVDMPAPCATLLVGRDVAEAVETRQEVECATEAAPENAMANPKPRKRKRRAKPKKEGQ